MCWYYIRERTVSSSLGNNWTKCEAKFEFSTSLLVSSLSLWFVFLVCSLSASWMYMSCPRFLCVCPYACLITVPLAVWVIPDKELWSVSVSSTESITWGKEWDTLCKSLTESYKGVSSLLQLTSMTPKHSVLKTYHYQLISKNAAFNIYGSQNGLGI